MDFLVLKKCHKPLPLPPFKPSTGIGSKPKISNLLLNIILLLKNLNNFEFRFANRLVGFDSSRYITLNTMCLLKVNGSLKSVGLVS